MKEFLITVNGKTYEVQVEELGEAPKETPKAAPAPPPAPAPKPETKPAPPAPSAAPASASAAGKTAIKCPMPGTIVKINVGVGDAVTAKTLLCVLEAMKMENEIFAGTDGVIASVNTSKGTSVNAGDLLFTIN